MSATDGGPEADPESVAHTICLRLLTAAPRTRAQLAAALERRNVPADAAEVVLGRLTEVGLVDDDAFAGAWVQSRHRGRGLSRRALAAELRQRGVQGATIERAVETLDDGAEAIAARGLVDRRLATMAGLPDEVRRRRVLGLLARKGYPAGLASRVVREALSDVGSTSAGDALIDPDWGEE